MVARRQFITTAGAVFALTASSELSLAAQSCSQRNGRKFCRSRLKGHMIAQRTQRQL